MADVITRFKVDTQEYDRKLDQSKKKLNYFSKAGDDAGKIIKNLAGKLGLVSVALGAASAAIAVVKDAFMQSESNIDEWGRTLESAKGAYHTFLNAINGGNWNNFFGNLQKSINDSRELYDALDRLGSVKANNAAAISLKENSLQQLRLKKENATDPKEIKELNKQIEQVSKEIASLKSQGSTAGMLAGRKQIENVLSSAFSGIEGAGSLRKTELGRLTNSMLTKGQGFFDEQASIYSSLGSKGVENLSKEEFKQYAIAKAITESETRLQEGMNTWSAAANEGAATTRELVKNLKQTKTNVGGESTSSSTVDTIDKPWSKLSGKYTDSMKSLGTVSGGSMSFIGSGIENAAANMDTSNLQKAAEDWDQYQRSIMEAKEANKQATGAIGAVGQALQSIGNPAAKVMGIIAESIATVASSFAAALATDTTSKGNIYAWIAAAAAGTGTMIATIASIKSATRYAEGGLIGGNIYSTDAQYARVNAGELILNRAQQGNLASQLQGNANDRMMQPYVNSETIYVGLNNYLMRSGKGVLVTSH